MVKRIIYVMVAIAIIAAGYTGFRKLNYWPRSARIFSYNPDQAFGGRPGREQRGNVQGNDFRPDFRSREGRDFAEGNRTAPGNFRRDENFQRGQAGESGRDFRRGEAGEPGRGGFRNDKKVNLRNVWWFLSVFGAFTVIAVYSDKTLKYLINTRKK